MTQEELTKVFKYIVKKCDMLINNGNYEADAYTQDTVEDIAELCNHILDGDYGKLVEVKEVQEEPVSEDLEKAAKRYGTEGDEISGLYIIDEEVEAFKAGAKWQKEKDQDAVEIAMEQMIKKFYDWLRSNATYIHPRKGTEECITTLSKLKEAMRNE